MPPGLLVLQASEQVNREPAGHPPQALLHERRRCSGGRRRMPFSFHSRPSKSAAGCKRSCYHGFSMACCSMKQTAALQRRAALHASQGAVESGMQQKS